MKAIFFDLGGVVVNWHLPTLYVEFAKKSGIPADYVTSYFKNNRDSLSLGLINLQQIFEALRKGAHGSEITVEKLKQYWVGEGLKIRTINQELLDWIDSNRKNYIIGAVTNLTPARLMLDEEIRLYDHFDFSVKSCVEHLKKPDPSFYQIALSKAELKPPEAIFIDDNEKYVKAAKDIGLRDLLFVNNQLLFEELKQL